MWRCRGQGGQKQGGACSSSQATSHQPEQEVSYAKRLFKFSIPHNIPLFPLFPFQTQKEKHTHHINKTNK